MPSSSHEALFDAASARACGLRIRSMRDGDRIAPVGMTGTRKLSDIFIDNKIPRARRATYPLVTIGDEIAWIPGLVRGRAALLSAKSRRAIRIGAIELPHNGSDVA